MRCDPDRNEAVLRYETCGLSLMIEGPTVSEDRGCKEAKMVIVRKAQIAQRFSGLSVTRLVNDATAEQTQRRTG
jgi:hypothetical protein